jgi:hypothetical protein
MAQRGEVQMIGCQPLQVDEDVRVAEPSQAAGAHRSVLGVPGVARAGVGVEARVGVGVAVLLGTEIRGVYRRQVAEERGERRCRDRLARLVVAIASRRGREVPAILTKPMRSCGCAMAEARRGGGIVDW